MGNLFSLFNVSRAAEWMATTGLRGEVTHHSQDLMCIFFLHLREGLPVGVLILSFGLHCNLGYCRCFCLILNYMLCNGLLSCGLRLLKSISLTSHKLML